MHFNATDFPFPSLGSHFVSFYLGRPVDIVRVSLSTKVFQDERGGPASRGYAGGIQRQGGEARGTRGSPRLIASAL